MDNEKGGALQRLLIANWKMNTDYKEAKELADLYCTQLNKSNNVKLVVCPPVIWLESLAKIFADTDIVLGVQNISSKEKGAITGEISALMVKKFAKYVICGHSERRRIFAETDEEIHDKIKMALKYNLTPILCIGEQEPFDGLRAGKEIFSEVSKATVTLTKEEIKKVVIVYEPVWAISANKNSQAATPDHAAEIIDSIRDRLSIIYGREISEKIKILYGGSVNSKNIKFFSDCQTIDGFLVGGASLVPEVFKNIYQSLIM